MDYTKNREGLQGKRRDLLPFSWYRAGKQGAALAAVSAWLTGDTTPRFSRSMTSALLARAWSWVTTTTHRFFPMGAVLENPSDLPGGVCVQIASGLIREDDRRLGGQSRAMATGLRPPERVAIRRRASLASAPVVLRGGGWGVPDRATFSAGVR